MQSRCKAARVCQRALVAGRDTLRGLDEKLVPLLYLVLETGQCDCRFWLKPEIVGEDIYAVACCVFHFGDAHDEVADLIERILVEALYSVVRL